MSRTILLGFQYFFIKDDQRDCLFQNMDRVGEFNFDSYGFLQVHCNHKIFKSNIIIPYKFIILIMQKYLYLFMSYKLIIILQTIAIISIEQFLFT